MYRSGESEYTINGSSCRLLDVQELLSDSGIGREMHVIVGQGSLDAVLGARPEDRRGFIEEAAGVLKHRKRKERALRKLDATATSIERLNDLAAELRRQLGPLGRQAEAARRAGAVQATLRDARLRLLADDIVNAGKALAARGEADGALATPAGRKRGAPARGDRRRGGADRLPSPGEHCPGRGRRADLARPRPARPSGLLPSRRSPSSGPPISGAESRCPRAATRSSWRRNRPPRSARSRRSRPARPRRREQLESATVGAQPPPTAALRMRRARPRRRPRGRRPA